MRKKILICIIWATMSLPMGGCSSVFVNEQAPLITSYTMDSLVDGIYLYNNSSKEFIVPCTSENTQTYTSKTEQSSLSRIIWYMPNNVETIPTLQIGNKIAYKNTKDIPAAFYLEAFEDMGVSFGIRGITLNNAGKYTITSSTSLYPNSSAAAVLSSSLETGKILLDNINGTPIDETMVNKIGAISVLEPYKKYTLGYYIGTNYYEEQLYSDTQMWVSNTVYTITNYENTKKGYIFLELPSLLPPALYDINGAGYFIWDGYDVEKSDS